MNPAVSAKITEHFSHGRERSYRKGQIIIQAGQEPPGISLLVDGVVEQYDITPVGNKVTINIFKPPAFFPMAWAINKTPNAYFFAALTDVTLRQAEAQATVDFLKAHPDVLFDLLSRVYKGTDALLRRLVIAAGGIASRRLIFELLIEAYRFGTESGSNTVLINPRQHSLASQSGLARETVSRELHKLANESFLTMTGSGIELNVKLLEKKLDIDL